jgi:molecular chaperone GrpE (heat shock protein)
MNDNDTPETSVDDKRAKAPAAPNADASPWASSLYRLCEEVIALREMNNRQHKVFEQTLARTRDALQASFNSFSSDTQRAHQRLRQEIHGEKRVSLALLQELLDIGFDLQGIAAARPRPDDVEGLARWAEAIEVEHRKVQAALLRHGIHRYDAVVGSAYNPALHERVGSKPVEGMGPLLIAEQTEPGYASQQPEFVLRRPKVVVTE